MSNDDVIAGNPGDAQSAADDSAGPDDNITSPQSSIQTMDQAAEIWTADEMLAAEPCDIIELDDEAIDAAAEALADEQSRLIPGGPPEDLDEPPPESADSLETLGYSYPAPFTRWENFADYRAWPYRAVGKLFFKRNGSKFVCSASSIGNCAIISAGHCLHSGNNRANGWSTDVIFVPAYRDGTAPYGQWPAKYSIVRAQWFKHGISKGLSEDIGGAILHKQRGRKISQRVGWLGFAWNWSRNQHWLSHGYPAGAPFNGQRMQINAGSFAYNGHVGANPAPVGMGNDLTGGSSGGPWIWRFGSNNYVNGVNSYRRSSKPKEMFSPYFGKAAKSLYDALKKGSC
ncbi:MAG: S1 family peptidase [Myxococcales bacterium FL481]|nr:MAG: S1 family peptidase [Myxococcales bacterium FL481]